MGRVMNNEELHFFGIKVVYKNLIDNNYEVLNVRKEIDTNPQILARKDDKLYFIVVRTAKYPHMGVLTPDVAGRVAMHAVRHNATCRFASVGVANANGENEDEMSNPTLGGEYYINFNGLSAFPQ